MKHRKLSIAVLVLALGLALMPSGHAARAAQTDIIGSSGSEEFGESVTVLANGNIVIAYPLYDAGSTPDVGAVYLYDGATLALISVLTGSTANDQVGSGGVTALSNGHYVVRSPDWDNGAVMDAGSHLGQ